MFLKEMNEKWQAMLLLLGTLNNATYKETTDAIEAYQRKIDLAEVTAKTGAAAKGLAKEERASRKVRRVSVRADAVLA